MKQYLLFDLDGTLTDPKTGITGCVQYALKEFGIDEPDLDRLEPFIGPPLKDSFMEFYGMSGEQADRAVEKYRERFQDTGIFENKLYDGVPRMLRILQSKGLVLAVASSKPTVFVERILEHFQIRAYFKEVVGSELDGTRTGKDEVVQEALNRLFAYKPIDKSKVYMIGDRKFDVEGAKAMGVESVGVTYGYGGMEELKQAGADYIVRSVEELEKFLLRGVDEVAEKEDPQRSKRLLQKRITVMLYGFLMFVLVRSLVVTLLSMLFQYIDGSLNFSQNRITLISALGFAGGGAAIWSKAKLFLKKTAEDMKLAHLKAERRGNYLLLGLSVMGFAAGLNLLFELSGFTGNSEAYRQVAATQRADSLVLMLLCYGLVTPVAEELLFRGLLYGCMRRFMRIPAALLLSAALFGLYHGNPVQGLYGFLMGCLMVYAYEYFGRFSAAVGVHIGVNLLAVLLTFTPIAATSFVSGPVCAVMLAVGAFGFFGLAKQKKIW